MVDHGFNLTYVVIEFREYKQSSNKRLLSWVPIQRSESRRKCQPAYHVSYTSELFSGCLIEGIWAMNIVTAVCTSLTG